MCMQAHPTAVVAGGPGTPSFLFMGWLCSSSCGENGVPSWHLGCVEALVPSQGEAAARANNPFHSVQSSSSAHRMPKVQPATYCVPPNALTARLRCLWRPLRITDSQGREGERLRVWQTQTWNISRSLKSWRSGSGEQHGGEHSRGGHAHYHRQEPGSASC